MILKFYSIFDEIPLSKQNSVLRRHIWGYSVCPCPLKGTPGLNELSTAATSSFLTSDRDDRDGTRDLPLPKRAL